MRYNGPVKGYIVLVNDDTGESTLHIVEPLHVSGAIYDALNSEYGKVTVQMGRDVTFPDILYGTPTSNLSVQQKNLGTGDGTATDFNDSFGTGVVPNTVKIFADGDEVGTDDGNGNIIGAGVTGTVDYTSGDVSVTFGTAPANGVVIKAEGIVIA